MGGVRIIGAASAAALWATVAAAQAPEGVGARDLDARAEQTAAICMALAEDRRNGRVPPRSVMLGGVERPVVDLGTRGVVTSSADVTNALRDAIDAAPEGAVLFLPPTPGDAVYRRDSVVTIARPDVQLCGYGARMLATEQTRATIEIAADGVGIFGLDFLSQPYAIADWPERWAASGGEREPAKYPDRDGSRFGWASSHVTVRPVRDTVLRGLSFDGARRGGIRVYGADNVLIERSCFRRTFSDGVQIADGATHVTARGNVVYGVGDDCISVVAYRRKGHPTIRSVLVEGNICHGSRARGLTVIGGEDVAILRNTVRDTLSAGILVHPSSSDDYDTHPVRNVTVADNEVAHSLRRDRCGHCGDITVDAPERTRPAENVLIVDNRLTAPPRGKPIDPEPPCPELR